VLRALASVLAYAAGVFAASRIAGRAVQMGSWPRPAKTALTLEVVAQTAFLVGWLLASGRPGTTLEIVLVGVAAVAMGLQSGAVRTLRVAGISTTYVTGTLTGLVADLAASSGSKRDRLARALVLVALCAGAACAAVLVADDRKVAPALPLAVTLLVLGAAARGARRREIGREQCNQRPATPT